MLLLLLLLQVAQWAAASQVYCGDLEVDFLQVWLTDLQETEDRLETHRKNIDGESAVEPSYFALQYSTFP